MQSCSREKTFEKKNEITMEELRKVADTCIDMLETEADCPYNHLELNHKVK